MKDRSYVWPCLKVRNPTNNKLILCDCKGTHSGFLKEGEGGKDTQVWDVKKQPGVSTGCFKLSGWLVDLGCELAQIAIVLLKGFFNPIWLPSGTCPGERWFLWVAVFNGPLGFRLFRPFDIE